MARPRDGEELPRPFDARRNGYLAGEGGAVLVLEREDHARARGATVLARVRASARGFDPTAPRTGLGHGHEELAALLRDRIGPELLAETDTVVSAGNGSVHGDALEARILHRALPHAPRVLTPKAVTGEFGGGTLAPAILALQGADFAAPVGCNQPDPALEVRLESGPVRAQRLLCSAHGAGGVSAWILFEQP